MVDLSVKVGALTLANPVMPASGTFADGNARVFDLNCLGAIVTKTITADIREGVPPPRPHDRILRTAFMAMTRDKAFLADMEKVGIRTSPIDGEAVSTLLQRAAATLTDIRDRFARMSGAK